LLDIVPHDTMAFTQGLEVLSQDKIDIMKRQLYPQAPITPPVVPSFAIESTEMDADSTLRIVELETGNVVQELTLEDNTHSGGGCTYYYAPPSATNRGGNTVLRVVQLTYKSGRGYVYDLTMPSTQYTTTSPWSLTLVGNFDFAGGTTNGDGWGIVYHPPRDQFIVSDGTRFLHFWKLTETMSANSLVFDFKLMEKVAVKELRESSENFVPSPVKNDWNVLRRVNELEWDPYSYGGNTILANVWKSDEILRIWVGLPVDGRGLDDDGGVRSLNNDNNNVGVRKLQNNQSVKDKKDAGKVSHVYDLTELTELAQPSRQGAVLNGIAFVYDSPAASTNINENEFWPTGKYWSSMYRIRLIDE
jgi:glutamine cyclotransferase